MKISIQGKKYMFSPFDHGFYNFARINLQLKKETCKSKRYLYLNNAIIFVKNPQQQANHHQLTTNFTRKYNHWRV